MPIYEYECASCGHRFEKMVKIGAEPPPCPECSAAVRKLISPSAFILKGGGWYKDHYGLKSDSSSGESSRSSGGSTKSEGSASKTESASPKSEGASASTSSSSEASKPAPAAAPSTAAK